MPTYTPKKNDIKREWVVIDADGVALGRLATKVAHLLKGKHKPIYSPHLDTGDYVIVINAGKVRLTGKKPETKLHYAHSGYIGSLKATPYKELLAKKPVFVVRKAVRGMLPHNRLGRAMIKKLKVYAGPEHRHQAQLGKSAEKAEVEVG